MRFGSLSAPMTPDAESASFARRESSRSAVTAIRCGDDAHALVVPKTAIAANVAATRRIGLAAAFLLEDAGDSARGLFGIAIALEESTVHAKSRRARRWGGVLQSSRRALPRGLPAVPFRAAIPRRMVWAASSERSAPFSS